MNVIASCQGQGARVLDIGCGQACLTLRLAQLAVDGEVIGVDFSGSAIAKARKYTEEWGIANAQFYEEDALAFVKQQADCSFDVVSMTEVSFYMPCYRDVLAQAWRILKNDGRLIVSFRSQYFDLLHLIQTRNWDSVELVSQKNEGSFGANSWFSWHTASGIRSMLSVLGFTGVELRGIGIC